MEEAQQQQQFTDFAKAHMTELAARIAELPDQLKVSATFNALVMLRQAIGRNPGTEPLGGILSVAMDRIDRIKDQPSYDRALSEVVDHWQALKLG